MARKHPVSPFQLVLWAHHQLTEAWTPSGILHPPQIRDCPRGAAENSRRTTGGRSRKKIKARPSDVQPRPDATGHNEQE